MKKILENDFDWVGDISAKIENPTFISFDDLTQEELLKIQQYIINALGYTWGDNSQEVNRFYTNRDKFYGYVIYPSNKKLYTSASPRNKIRVTERLDTISGRDFLSNNNLNESMNFDWVEDVPSYQLGSYFTEDDIDNKIFFGKYKDTKTKVTYNLSFDEFFQLVFNYEGPGEHHEDYDLFKKVVLHEGTFVDDDFDEIGMHEDEFYLMLSTEQRNLFDELIKRRGKLLGEPNLYYPGNFDTWDPDYNDLDNLIGYQVYSGRDSFDDVVWTFKEESNKEANISGWNHLNSEYLRLLKVHKVDIDGDVNEEMVEITLTYPYESIKIVNKYDELSGSLVPDVTKTKMFDLTETIKSGLYFLKRYGWNDEWLSSDYGEVRSEETDKAFNDFIKTLNNHFDSIERGELNEDFGWTEDIPGDFDDDLWMVVTNCLDDVMSGPDYHRWVDSSDYKNLDLVLRKYSLNIDDMEDFFQFPPENRFGEPITNYQMERLRKDLVDGGWCYEDLNEDFDWVEDHLETSKIDANKLALLKCFGHGVLNGLDVLDEDFYGIKPYITKGGMEYLSAEQDIMDEVLFDMYVSEIRDTTIGEWDESFVNPYDYMSYIDRGSRMVAGELVDKDMEDMDLVGDILPHSEEMIPGIVDRFNKVEKTLDTVVDKMEGITLDDPMMIAQMKTLEEILRQLRNEKEDILDKATNIVRDKLFDNHLKQIKKDPVKYLVDELGYFEDADRLYDLNIVSLDDLAFAEAMANKRRYTDLSHLDTDYCVAEVNKVPYICIRIH